MLSEILNVDSAMSNKKVLQGVVVSDKMDKTIVVSVVRSVRHSMYGKVLKLRKKYKVHDEKEIAKIGDAVEIQECAPKSKTKHMMLVKIVKS